MKKRYALIFLLILTMLMGVSCGNSNVNYRTGDRESRLQVYDSEDKLLYEINNDEFNEYFKKFANNGTEKLDENKMVDLPDDAKVSYDYRFVTDIDGEKTFDIDFYVYSNYPYMTIKGIPLVPSITFKLTKKDNKLFQHPEKIAEENR